MPVDVYVIGVLTCPAFVKSVDIGHLKSKARKTRPQERGRDMKRNSTKNPQARRLPPDPSVPELHVDESGLHKA